MKEICSVETMRICDASEVRRVGAKELMQRAGEAFFASYPWAGRVTILAGEGNNGGDGFVLALCLQARNIACRVLIFGEPKTEESRYFLALCRENGISVEKIEENTPSFADDTVIADCIFGTGFHGNAEGIYADVIRAVNVSGKPVVSADINSGLNGNNGQGEPAVKSDLTVAIGCCKAGHFLGRAKDLIGNLTCVDIGIPMKGELFGLAEPSDFGEILRKRQQISHKGDFGYVGILGGCTEYTGAVKLANLSCSALRAGAGVATLIVPSSLASCIAPYLLESTLARIPDVDGAMQYDPKALDAATSRLKALAVGMGWGQRGENGRILLHLLNHYNGRLVLDADALNTLADLGSEALKPVAGRAVLTPHLKEFERICRLPMERILQDPIGCAQQYAKTFGVTLLLKGPTTVITDGKETLLVNRGCAGMATAGSGDVLSGILAGLLGCNDATPMTAACGAFIAGLAGELAEEKGNAISMTSSDTVLEIGNAISNMIHSV